MVIVDVGGESLCLFFQPEILFFHRQKTVLPFLFQKGKSCLVKGVFAYVQMQEIFQRRRVIPPGNELVDGGVGAGVFLIFFCQNIPVFGVRDRPVGVHGLCEQILIDGSAG